MAPLSGLVDLQDWGACGGCSLEHWAATPPGMTALPERRTASPPWEAHPTLVTTRSTHSQVHAALSPSHALGEDSTATRTSPVASPQLLTVRLPLTEGPARHLRGGGPTAKNSQTGRQPRVGQHRAGNRRDRRGRRAAASLQSAKLVAAPGAACL